MQSWDKHWYGPVAAIRPYLFQKCLLLTVAMDLLVLMVERGGRYGLDLIPFNVPHFSWLQPWHQLFLPFGVPNATYYVAVAVVTSFLAFCLLLTGHRPWLMATVALLYTYAWSMSRLDSYLHHYMLSLILGCMVFFPPIDARCLRDWWTEDPSSSKNGQRANEKSFSALAYVLLGLALAYRFSLSRAIGLTTLERWISMFVCCGALVALVFRWNKGGRDGIGPRVSTWSFRLLATTVGVIYVFTSIAKMDAEWCGGHTLQQVGATADVLLPVEQLAGAIGVSRDWFWAGLATFVLPLELTLAFSYMVAVRQDEEGRTWLRRWCFFAWLLAVGLHLNNEMMNLVIQWFGYYMLTLATLILLPARILLTLGTVFIWPESWVREQYELRLTQLTNEQAAVALGIVSVSAVIGLLSCGFFIWIAGAIVASMILASTLVIVLVFGVIVGWERKSITVSLAALGASLLMTIAVAQCSMRFDYYDMRGKTLQQLGSNHEAINEMEIAASLGAPSNETAAELLSNLGLSYRMTDDRKKAETSYRIAIGLNPRQFLAHYGLANLLVERDDRHDEAEHHYRQAIAIKSDFSDAYVNLGNLLEFREKIDQAIQCYEAALTIETEASDIQQMLAAAREKLAGTEYPATR